MAANVMHQEGLPRLYERLLAGTSATARSIEMRAGRHVHVIEAGNGPALVLLHGTSSSAPFFLPLLQRLNNVRAIAPDRPGQGLSDPAEVSHDHFREAAVECVDELLDALDLETASLLGHSMGGLWSLWYALAHPARVERLVLLGPPGLPGTRAPLPYRIMATPGVGEVLQRLAPPTPKSLMQFARFMGEKDTIIDHPDLIDLLVACGRDPVARRTDLAEIRACLSPYATVSRSGFRGRILVQPGELRRLAVPTLLLWGEHEPLGDAAVAKATIDLLPRGRLEVLPAGHAPWLGHPDRVADVVTAFVRSTEPAA
jgi:2-hydroxy-6-oxonona-2,4-dienedioate hydrolase